MLLIFSLDSVLLILAALMFLGIGWASLILSWLWQHAVLIGIILLVLHIIVNLGHTKIAAENYGGLGIICSVIHAVAQPLLVVKSYSATAASEMDLNVFVIWFVVFSALLVSENFWYKASEARGGLSVGSLLVNTCFSVGICAFLIYFIHIHA